MNRIDFHKKVENEVNKGNRIVEAFALIYERTLPLKPFNTYSYYKSWKSLNSIKKTKPKFKCVVCGVVEESNGGRDEFCSNHKEPSSREFKATDIIKEKTIEPDVVKKYRSKVKKHWREGKDLALYLDKKEAQRLRKVIARHNSKYGNCNVCGELYSKEDSNTGMCSVVCQAAYTSPDTYNIKQCANCGVDYHYSFKSYRIHCSDECRNDHINSKRREHWNKRNKLRGNYKRRCKQYGKNYEHINRTKVFKEESYICYLCGVKTDKNADVNDDIYPNLDHVVPLSRLDSIGMRLGHHVRSNVRCSCSKCNNNKGRMTDKEYLNGDRGSKS